MRLASIRLARSLATLVAPLIALTALLLTVACAAAPSDDVVAFTDVNVVPMDGERVLENRTVVVRGERIDRIGPTADVDVPDGATVVDGAGRWLVPGIAEMHAHVPNDVDAIERTLFLYLSNGITTIRGMLGAPVHLDVRERIETGEMLGPRFYTSGPSFNGNSIPDPDSARRAVRHQADAGYDFLKIHPGVSREAYDAMVDEAEEIGIRWAGHVPADVGLERALEAGQASVDHLDRYAEMIVRDGADTGDRTPAIFGFHLADVLDRSKIPAVAEATRDAGVWNVPTQSLMVKMVGPESADALAQRPEMRFMPPQTVSGWAEAKSRTTDAADYSAENATVYLETRLALIRGLHDAGARLLLGSDAPQIFQVPGFSIRDEVRAFDQAGLAPFDILAAGTRSVAEYFDDLDAYGTVEEDKAADLILLEANPLDDIDNLFRQAGVMVRGQWLPAEEIQRRLDAIAAEYDAAAEE